MIDNITQNLQNNKINFCGKSFSKKLARNLCEGVEDVFAEGKKFKNPQNASPENFLAYSKIEKLCLSRLQYGYAKASVSKPLAPYVGDLTPTAGFSTEFGGYGGGWIKSSIKTPLSTTDVHTCAMLNLVDEPRGEHFLYHVFDSTSINYIKRLIREEFPRFNKVNILPGDMFKTNKTVNNILAAINEVNPKASKEFYHLSSDTPEIVACGGKLSFIPSKSADKMAFTETYQYWY